MNSGYKLDEDATPWQTLTLWDNSPYSSPSYKLEAVHDHSWQTMSVSIKFNNINGLLYYYYTKIKANTKDLMCPLICKNYEGKLKKSNRI